MIRTLSNLGVLGFSLVVTLAAPAPGPSYALALRRTPQTQSLVV